MCRTVEPIFLINLLAAGSCQEHVEAKILLVQIHAEGECPVAFDQDSRLKHRLIDIHVGGAGDLAEFARQFLSIREIGIEVRPVDLQVDWRERAEIKNLIGQISRLKREFRSWIALRQTFAENVPNVPHRRPLILQRDGQIAILSADRWRWNKGKVMRSDGETAITDNRFDVTGQHFPDVV